jgi:hypothetical protein
MPLLSSLQPHSQWVLRALAFVTLRVNVYFSLTFTMTQNWDHIMSMFSRLWAERLKNCGQIHSWGKKFFSSPKCPGCPWDPPSLFNRHWELFLHFVKLTTHLLSESTLRLHEPECTFPHMPSYCGI